MTKREAKRVREKEASAKIAGMLSPYVVAARERLMALEAVPRMRDVLAKGGSTMSALSQWHAVCQNRPEAGTWVMMYLPGAVGIHQYCLGVYMGRDEWNAATDWPTSSFRDINVSHWMPLPLAPGEGRV